MADQRLARSTPEAQGIASSALLAFVEALEQRVQHTHSVMLVRHGAVVAEGWWHPYAPERPHVLFSLSKSFTSTAVGLAVEEKLLNVDDSVASFFPDELPAEPSANLLAMRVRHLLSMSTGHDQDTTTLLREQTDTSWVEAFLAQPVEHEPGTHFVYNSGATYLLSAIVQRLTGLRLLDYLEPRLFAPLGIRNPTWERSPQGIDTGGWGLSISTEDIACFGQLYLQNGVWQGQQLVPSAWIAGATSAQISNAGSSTNPDWEQGYGYQFWRCRHNAYRGDGAFGQFCVVLPEHDAVLAITSGVQEMQPTLDLVWEHLLPAFTSAPLPESAAHAHLTQKLAQLQLPPLADRAQPERIAEATFQCESNDLSIETISFAFGDTRTLTLRNGTGEHRVASGNGAWETGTTALGLFGSPHIAASSGWTAPNTFEALVYFVETPFALSLVFRFADEGEHFHALIKPNVGFNPDLQWEFVGRRS